MDELELAAEIHVALSLAEDGIVPESGLLKHVETVSVDSSPAAEPLPIAPDVKRHLTAHRRRIEHNKQFFW